MGCKIAQLAKDRGKSAIKPFFIRGPFLIFEQGLQFDCAGLGHIICFNP